MVEGWSQRQVATLAGIGLRTYQDWEAGRTVPFPGPHLVAICSVLRTSPLFLYFGEEGDAHAVD